MTDSLLISIDAVSKRAYEIAQAAHLLAIDMVELVKWSDLKKRLQDLTIPESPSNPEVAKWLFESRLVNDTAGKRCQDSGALAYSLKDTKDSDSRYIKAVQDSLAKYAASSAIIGYFTAVIAYIEITKAKNIFREGPDV